MLALPIRYHCLLSSILVDIYKVRVCATYFRYGQSIVFNIWPLVIFVWYILRVYALYAVSAEFY